MMTDTIMTKRIRVYGIVQGVGFRPTVDRHAKACGIGGTVCNKGPYVEIYAQGTEKQIGDFLYLLKNKSPERAVILKIDVKDAGKYRQFDEFNIVLSETTSGEIFIPPDIAVCEDCKRELFDPKNRRYLHPFINCTLCGPRLTILEALPYDRERTSMKMFPMCRACSEEYHDIRSRRYDAQPVCCNDCGPQVYILGEEGVRGKEAITRARRVLSEGGIVAVKGIGGFHLACDATRQEAVERLRKRKRRPMKPFAVMMRDERVARRECAMLPGQEKVLTGHQKPILLLDRRPGGLLCESVAPDNPRVGVMLPYAPLQLLLFTYDDGIEVPDCLVMTSANVSGAPICRDDKDARQELAGLADLILSHDREIRIRADDSVMDFYREKPYMVRRSRGYAPLPYLLTRRFEGTVAAVGGELKNTFCIGTGSLFYPSSYIGDLSDIRSVKALEETMHRYAALLEVHPQAAACDLHPKYNSTAVAEKLSEENGIPVIPVQHHFAHIVSCMAENDYDGRVIGVSFDGTGYGTDGTIWGGEILEADFHGFQRRGSIRPFLQTGGDASSRDGWRIAVSMICSLFPDRDRRMEVIRKLALCDERTAAAQFMLHDKKMNAVVSTSAGRLFDAVSAVLGIRKSSTFEGEASTALEFAAEEYRKGHPEPEQYQAADMPEGSFFVLPTDRIIGRMIEGALQGEDRGGLALLFHRMLADQIVQACVWEREKSGLGVCALSGGCFQNRLLLELVQGGLEQEGFRVLIHSLVPPNDGGIALGQAVAAMQFLQDRKG